MSLSDWIVWPSLYSPTAVILAPALILFIWQYGASKRRTTHKINVRLERLHRSLEIYAAATGALLREIDGQNEPSSAEHAQLVDKLLACKAAPYATEDLLAQITAYTMNEGDRTRLTLLLRTIERETERLVEERSVLLRRTEKPGWGWSLWQQFHHALPFIFTVGIFMLVLWLLGSLDSLGYIGDERWSTSEDQWSLLYIWTRFLSCLFSLLILYPYLRGWRRESSSSLLQRWLAVIIALTALLHMIGLSWAPYIFTLQLLLFLAGFRFSHNKPRKSRPFVGHYFEENELSALEAQLVDSPDLDMDSGLKSKDSGSP
ncbi:hypothetical protein [Paenibacillus lentus]|uniref:Uncharacterized protein n=1 Tax=Paenibacillus lentus TaxID=1338368 RepID=A0A3S8RPW9_9BACL|nr:hypothetical protein [Paenibacillus lentus]AZK45006.1 hypothetical protein EIM92_01365 [Paenibacillus lentus]